jgi:hypothetical protein
MAMTLIDTILTLAAQTRGRLSGIGLAAIIDGQADCPAVARITWSAVPAEVAEISAAWLQPEPAIWTLPGLDAEAADAAFLTVAWQLGAWDVLRTERAPLPPEADPMAPMHGITAALGAAYMLTGEQPVESAVDVRRWAHAAARHGWITWYAKPMHLAPPVRVNAWQMRDRSLLANGIRAPRDFAPHEPVWIGTDHQTVIRLGRP